jgi:hypothetical protein
MDVGHVQQPDRLARRRIRQATNAPVDLAAGADEVR